MEELLLSPHKNILGKQGIPLSLVKHLVKADKYYDVNLRHGYAADRDIDEIHELESSLGHFNADSIERRIAADFCCIWRYDYPERIHDICSIIGGNSHTALRLHYQVNPARRQELIDYAEALKAWLAGTAPQEVPGYIGAGKSTIDKVYHYLGKQEPLKNLLVERTYYGLSRRSINCSFWGVNEQDAETPLYPYNPQKLPRSWQDRMAHLESAIHKELGRAAHDFLCDVGGSAEPACHFKFIRRIDILISSIGCMQWRGNLPPKDKRISGRRQITRAYMQVLESYWRRLQIKDADQELTDKLFALLGPSDDCKRWLVGCLWKNIRNQTEYHAYPMRHWVDFVKIGEDYIDQL